MGYSTKILFMFIDRLLINLVKVFIKIAAGIVIKMNLLKSSLIYELLLQLSSQVSNSTNGINQFIFLVNNSLFRFFYPKNKKHHLEIYYSDLLRMELILREIMNYFLLNFIKIKA